MDIPAATHAVFGHRMAAAERYVALLAGPGVTRGLIGPREADRLSERHMLNSAVLAELVPAGAQVLDVGSGAGFPGIPLAFARPDLELTLLEPMARRVAWLEQITEELGLPVRVHRGRVEDVLIRAELGEWEIVTARAVAPLGRLASWCLPLVVPGGRLLAIKGAQAGEEVVRDADAVRSAGGGAVDIVRCGTTVVSSPTTVIVVRRRAPDVTQSGSVAQSVGAPRRKER